MKLIKVLLTIACSLLLKTSFAQQGAVRSEPFFPKRWSMPSELPDRIILTFSGDPSTQQSITWRTDTSIKKSMAEIAVADGAPKFWRNGTVVNAATSTMDARNI